MQKLAVAILLAVGLVLVGCGTSNNSGNINGNWTATLTDTNKAQALSFTTSIAQITTDLGALRISTSPPIPPALLRVNRERGRLR
jgi:hypothetical protein